MLRAALLSTLFASASIATPLQTFQGFELAADINQSAQYPLSSSPSLMPGGDALGPVAIYRAKTLDYGEELYAVELDKPATLLQDIDPGAFPLAPDGASLVSIEHGGKLYFTGNDPLHGFEIWVTDGTPAGTHLWNDFTSGPESSNPLPVLSMPGGFLFTTGEVDKPRNLFYTTSVPGTEVALLQIVGEGWDQSGPFHLAWNGLAYFKNESPLGGEELWVTDGTPAGTHILYDFTPGAHWTRPLTFHDFGGLTYMTLWSSSPTTNRKELWSTDGTAANTKFIMEIDVEYPVAIQTPTYFGQFVEFKGKLLFTALRASTGGEIWALDGTGAPPQPVTDLNLPGSASAPDWLTPFGDQLLFTIVDTQVPNQPELWTMGAAPMSEQLLADINPSGNGNPSNLTVSGGHVYFRALNATLGVELWRTDGTTAGTQVVADLVPGSGSSSPSEFAAVPGGLFFRASLPDIGQELFQVKNGVVSLHTDIEPAKHNVGSDPTDVRTLFARDLYLAALSTSLLGKEPHALLADDSIVELGDLNPGFTPSDSREFTGVVQGGHKRVFFSARPAGTTRDLFVSDGTAAGTQALGLSGVLIQSDPVALTAFRDEVYFTAETLAGDLELWRSDGTLVGTHQVTMPGPLGERAPHELVVAGPHLFFSALDDGGFRNVYRTDGTTVTQISFQTIDAANGVEQLANVRGRLVFIHRLPSGASFVVYEPVLEASYALLLDAGFKIGINQVADPLYAPTAHGSRYYVFGCTDALGWGYHSLNLDDGPSGSITVHGSTTLGHPLQPSDGHSLRFIGALGYFVGDGPKGVELYSLTATPFSTQLVFDAAGYNPIIQSEESGFPRDLVVAGNDLYFHVMKSDDPTLRRDILTTSGGLITTACELSDWSLLTGPQELVLANGSLYFTIKFNASVGSEVFRRPELGAHVVDFGTNASGGVLEIDAPIMNTNCGVYLRNQAPGTVTTLWFSGVNSGVASDPATGLTVPGDALWLNPLTASFSGFATSTDFLKAIPIPSATQLINKSFIVQGVMVDPLNPATLRTTNAKLVTLGF